MKFRKKSSKKSYKRMYASNEKTKKKEPMPAGRHGRALKDNPMPALPVFQGCETCHQRKKSRVGRDAAFCAVPEDKEIP